MGEYPAKKPPTEATPRRSTTVPVDQAPPTPQQLQATAHARRRICKVSGCDVCAPLRERRRLQKAARKADAQAQSHAKRQPCGRASCSLDICVEARRLTPADSAPAGKRVDASDPAESLRRQQERHRAGVPCGVESCPRELCTQGVAQERARRHRARRPCRFVTCDNPICVAARSKA
jgi:hypothetical protein